MTGPQWQFTILFMAALIAQVGRAPSPVLAEETVTGRTSSVEGQAVPKAAKVRVLLLALSGSYVYHPQTLPVDAAALLQGRAPTQQKSFFRLVEYLE